MFLNLGTVTIQNTSPNQCLIALAVSEAALAISEPKNAMTPIINPNTITSA